MAREPARYRFGPLERRGLIAGWRGGQIASVAGGLIVAVLALRSRPSPAGIVIALVAVGGGAAFGCWPVAGRSGDQWLPTVVRWGPGWASGSRRHRSPAPEAGRCLGPDGQACLEGSRRTAGGPGPPDHAGGARHGPFASLGILTVHGGTTEGPIGVIHDARSRTYTAVLEVQGHSFALLGSDEKERRVGGWAAVLSSLARERPVVHRLQWIASTLPDDGEAVRGFLADQSALTDEAPARRSYESLLAGAGASTCRHEVHLAVQVRAGRRTATVAGGGDAGACSVLLREVGALRQVLADGEVSVERVLGPRAVASMVRRSGQVRPFSASEAEVPRPEDDASSGRSCPPCAVGWPWPMAVEAEWGRLRTDGTWQATYWIAEWPRVEVGPDFLGPLLLGPVRRTVSVVMEPMSPSRATRQAEQARTADLADAELRRRGGFLSTARRARESEVATRREAELADGHAAVRFSGYVTVTAPTETLLIEACNATEQAAGQCRLELRRLFGDQELTFTYTLPLCRGLG